MRYRFRIKEPGNKNNFFCTRFFESVDANNKVLFDKQPPVFKTVVNQKGKSSHVNLPCTWSNISPIPNLSNRNLTEIITHKKSCAPCPEQQSNKVYSIKEYKKTKGNKCITTQYNIFTPNMDFDTVKRQPKTRIMGDIRDSLIIDIAMILVMSIFPLVGIYILIFLSHGQTPLSFIKDLKENAFSHIGYLMLISIILNGFLQVINGLIIILLTKLLSKKVYLSTRYREGGLDIIKHNEYWDTISWISVYWLPIIVPLVLVYTYQGFKPVILAAPIMFMINRWSDVWERRIEKHYKIKFFLNAVK